MTWTLRRLLARARPEPWPGLFTPPRYDLLLEEARAERDQAEAECDRLAADLAVARTRYEVAEHRAQAATDALNAVRDELLRDCSPIGPEHRTCRDLAHAQGRVIEQLTRANIDRDAVGLAALRGRPRVTPEPEGRPSTTPLLAQGQPEDLAAPRVDVGGAA